MDEGKPDKGLIKWFKGELIAIITGREEGREVPGPSRG